MLVNLCRLREVLMLRCVPGTLTQSEACSVSLRASPGISAGVGMRSWDYVKSPQASCMLSLPLHHVSDTEGQRTCHVAVGFFG